MGVEQDDVRLRVLVEDRAQDQRGGAGLAGAGGAENGEVLAEQVVGLDHRRDGRVLSQRTDPDGVVADRGKRGDQFCLGRHPDAVAERRID